MAYSCEVVIWQIHAENVDHGGGNSGHEIYSLKFRMEHCQTVLPSTT